VIQEARGGATARFGSDPDDFRQIDLSLLDASIVA